MNRKTAAKNISIRNIIIIVFMVLMLTTVSVIGYIIFSNWLSSADKTTTKMVDEMSTEIFGQVDSFLQNSIHINEVNHELIKNDIVDITNQTEREKFFVGVLKTHSNDTYSFSYGTEEGEYHGARRNEKGVIEIMRNNPSTDGHSWYYSLTNEMTAKERVVDVGKFDPRTRDWYKAARKTKIPVFSKIYQHFVMDDLAVSATYPIYNKDEELQGVLGTHIVLSNINNFLREIVEDKNGIAVIVEKNSGELIANSSNMKNFITLKDRTVKRLKLVDSENQAIRKAYEQYISTEESRFKIKNGNDSLYINITEYHKEGLDWIFITAIPKSLLMAGITENMKLTFLLVVLAVIISVAIYFILTNKLFKPIERLIEVTEMFSQGDLSQRVTVVRNDEIGKISVPFNKMADTINKLVNNLEATVSDRTLELEKVNYALEESKDQLRLILDSTAEAIYGIDRAGKCTFCNASCLEILGYKHQDELLGQNMHYHIPHSRKNGRPMPIEECRILKTFVSGEGTHVDDEMFWRADGTSFNVEYFSYPQYKDGEIIGLVVTFMDITERKTAEDNIRYLSYHDSLTGLYNRMFFKEELRRLDTERNLPISIIVGDVNGLKLTNDVFGHVAGDLLLKKVAEVFKRVFRADDIIARVGGDEFVILLPYTKGKEAEEIMLRIKNGFSEEHIHAIRTSISLGYDTKEYLDQDITKIMENAEDKMYQEKTLDCKTMSTKLIVSIIETLHRNSHKEELHSKNVSELCQNIGRAMNLSAVEIRRLREAGFLHDIGKITLDKSVLNKDNLLTDLEIEDMKQHPVIGYRILNYFEDTMDLAESVLAHHERWDGSGYPKGLKGVEIPKLARIIAVAESYDAIINRPNIYSVSKEVAIQEIRNQAGLMFDSDIVEIFSEMVLQSS